MEPGVFGSLEPEPLEKKNQEPEPEPLGKKNQEPEPLEKKVRSRKKNLPAPQPCMAGCTLIKIIKCLVLVIFSVIGEREGLVATGNFIQPFSHIQILFLSTFLLVGLVN